MKTIIAIAVMFSTIVQAAQPQQPALTGKRRAEFQGSKIIEKAERKKTGKKGATNEWESARSFPIMFARPTLIKKPKKETRP
jgi:hypothetical protein